MSSSAPAGPAVRGAAGAAGGAGGGGAEVVVEKAEPATATGSEEDIGPGGMKEEEEEEEAGRPPAASLPSAPTAKERLSPSALSAREIAAMRMVATTKRHGLCILRRRPRDEERRQIASTSLRRSPQALKEVVGSRTL